MWIEIKDKNLYQIQTLHPMLNNTTMRKITLSLFKIF